MSAFYNERDPYAAQWLRNLIDAGHIAPGVVDERDIRDIRPDELSGFTQCHFFAGIGVWAHALRRAGWPDDRQIWTGSCPCQPFSAAGAGKGFADERHLWPHWFHLVAQHGPAIVLGEQVASKDGLGWLDLVSTDLEGAGYAFAAADLCAAGFAGGHIRSRLYFVGMGDAEHAGLEGLLRTVNEAEGRPFPARSGNAASIFNDGVPSLLGRDAVDWLQCGDNYWRPVRSGTFPLAHAAPARVGRLRAYGNALDAETATAFVEAVMSGMATCSSQHA